MSCASTVAIRPVQPYRIEVRSTPHRLVGPGLRSLRIVRPSAKFAQLQSHRYTALKIPAATRYTFLSKAGSQGPQGPAGARYVATCIGLQTIIPASQHGLDRVNDVTVLDLAGNVVSAAFRIDEFETVTIASNLPIDGFRAILE